MSDATDILSRIEQGDPSAAEKLLPLVYQELRRLAAARLAHERHQHTLDATALVHEAYLRLVNVEQPQHFKGRSHFFAAAAEAMRRILVENARRRQTLKQGGAMRRVAMQPDDMGRLESVDRVLEIDEALSRLEAENSEVAKLVKLKFFAGFTLEEAAAAMELSVRTAYRYWAYGKAWLRKDLGR